MLAKKPGSALLSTMRPSSNDISGSAVGSERWSVAQTQPCAEGRAVAHLERQGYRVFCPRYHKTVRHARKVTQILAPLFPNYLFLRLDTSRDLWRAVNGTRGVMDWIPTFKIGQAVRNADGPFVNLVGKLEHLEAAGRVRLLHHLFGRQVSVALLCEATMAAS
jgi:transcriptional antiterminator RfaH